MSRKYISVEYTEETQTNLRKWACDLGFDIFRKYSGDMGDEPMNYHTTVIYSSPKPTRAPKVSNTAFYMPPTKVVATGLKWYAPNIPVIEINSPEISAMHQFWLNFGLIHSYPEFKPHISLAYDRGLGVLPDSIPDFDLSFDRIVIEDIKE